MSESSTPAKPSRKQRLAKWRRRLAWLSVIVLFLAIIIRLMIPMLFPMVLSRFAAAYGFTANYERTELNLLSGDVGIWHLTLTPKNGGEPVVTAGYVRGNISTLALLTADLEVWRVEADGLDVLIERDEKGEIPLLTQLLDALPKEAKPEKPAPATQPIDLVPPLKIDAFRLTNITATLRDKSVTPMFETRVVAHARLSDVGSDRRPVQFAAQVLSNPLVDLLHVEGTAKTSANQIDASATLQVKGVDLRPIAGYLAPLGLKPTSGNIALQADSKIRISTTQPADCVAATVDLTNLRATADGTQTAKVDQVHIAVDRANGSGAKISQALLQGIGAYARRNANGNIAVGGFELLPVTTESSSELPNYALAVDELKIADLKADFDDAAVSPTANLGVIVDDLTVRNIVLDPAAPPVAMQIDAKLRSPGIAGAIVLQGTTTTSNTANLSLAVDQIKPDALEPYLQAMGLESLLKHASFHATVLANWTSDAAGLRAGAKISNIQFADGPDLLAMSNITLDGVSIDQKNGALKIGTIELTGPVLSAQREPNGAVQVLGIRYSGIKPSNSRTVVETTSPASPTTAPVAALPKLEVGLLRWKDIKFQFEDRTLNPPTVASLADAGLEIRNFKLDLESTSNSTPGELKAWLEAPNTAERIDVTGTLQPSPHALDVKINVKGSGITAASAAPYLKSVGIEPVLSNGMLNLDASASLKQSPGKLDVAMSLSNIKFADGEQELLGLDDLTVQNLSLGEEISLETLAIKRPRAVIRRDEQGRFIAAGMRTIPAAPSTQPVAPAPDAPVGNPLDLPLPQMVATVRSLELDEAGLTWIDSAVSPGVKTTATVSAALDNFVFGMPASPATYNVSLSADGILDRIAVTGQLLASPKAQLITADVTGQGIRAGALQNYLPAGIQSSLKNGQLRARLQASIDTAEAGGKSAQLMVSGVDWSDGTEKYFSLGSAKVIAPRVDPVNGTVAVSEISTDGIIVDAQRRPDGTFAAMGFVFSAPPASEKAETEQPAPAATQPMVVSTAPAGNDVSAIVARARRPLPLITLDRLDVGIERLTFTDLARPDAAPAILNGLRLFNPEKIELAGKDPENRKPIQLRVDGSIDPLVGSLLITTTAAPFAQQPTLSTEVLISGIQGEGLTRLIPELKETIDGTKMTAGEFHTHLDASARLQRRGPYDFDFSRGFDLDLTVKDIAFRSEKDGPVLAGLQQIETLGARIEPAKGNVILKSLELTKPIFHGWRDGDGVHLLGWVIKLPQASETPSADTATTQPAAETVVELKPESSSPAAPVASAKPANEIRIDKLLINGIDVKIEDRTMQPPVILPLSELDVEVRGLTNLALYEAKPIRFNALINSGKAPLPTKVKGGLDLNNFTDREVFSQIAASGNMVLYPSPTGWTKTSINGFEAVAVMGAAAQAGVNVGGGVYDGTIDARFESGAIKVSSRHVMTDLKLTEGDDGPVRKALKLPSPLNVVIGALEDVDGSITLPVGVTVKEGEIKGIGGAAAGAVSSVILTAVASAPVKVVAGFGSMVGLKGKKGEPLAPIELLFPGGYTGVESSERAKLQPAIDALRKEKNADLTLRHELGSGDLQRAEMRSNPSTADISNLAFELRQRKMQLLKLRSEVSGAARGELAVRTAADSTLEQLRAIDRQIAQTETALDEVYDLLRPGADRQAPRRTKAAAIVIAAARLESTKALLLTEMRDLPKIDERIHVTNPTFTQKEGSEDGVVTVTVVAKKR